MGQASEQLIKDHAAVDKILQQLQTAIQNSDLEIARAKLDLFWARLAVHIRAEHLHLFPTVLRSLEDAAVSHASAPSLDEAQTVIAELRRDHDFFMHELARAIEIMRQPLTTILAEGLDDVRNIVLQVEQRLVKHNEVEESQIYRWTPLLLNSVDQEILIERITMELRKHPARFTKATWSDH